MLREVKEAMITFLDIFKKKGIALYMGENVLVISEELLGVCRQLDAINALHEENVMDILTGLTIIGNFCFHDMFRHLKQGAEFDLLPLPLVTIESSLIEKIEAILDKAIKPYNKLCVACLWLKVTKQNIAAFVRIVVKWDTVSVAARSQRIKLVLPRIRRPGRNPRARIVVPLDNRIRMEEERAKETSPIWSTRGKCGPIAAFTWSMELSC